MISGHKLDYSAESFQKRKIENFEKVLESQTKLINLRFMDIWEELEKKNNLQNVQDIPFNNGETELVVNAKVFLDIKNMK